MTSVRGIVATLLATSLFTGPIWSAPVSTLGTVVSAEGARVGAAIASVGTTVFSGDKLSTAQAGSMQLRAGAARFLLSQSSAATLTEENGMPAATLLAGTATFSTANSKALTLHAATAVIRPKNDEPTIGQVTLLSVKQLLVKCTRGSLTITVDDDSRVIPEGAAYRVVLEPGTAIGADDQPPPRGAGTRGDRRQPPAPPGRNRFIWIVIGVTAVLTFIAVDEAVESPDRP